MWNIGRDLCCRISRHPSEELLTAIRHQIPFPARSKRKVGEELALGEDLLTHATRIDGGLSDHQEGSAGGTVGRGKTRRFTGYSPDERLRISKLDISHSGVILKYGCIGEALFVPRKAVTVTARSVELSTVQAPQAHDCRKTGGERIGQEV
ncbi:unnamed protein product [Taenia asiatica]|uniref:PilZ domain-containing protein n=1 Tax=Taenia asiatica TaxID=60517 RepID=A0A0R3WF30_TAEAS|nr:unnamed protein product [Taenia asiatica]